MTTTSSTTPFVSADAAEEAEIAYAEHQAYREVDCAMGHCDTCEELSQTIEDLWAQVTTLDCDGCGKGVTLRTNPKDLVLVLCRDCNGGTAIR